MNLKGLSTYDLYILAVFKDQDIMESLKNEHNKTYKRHRKRYKELIANISENNLYSEVEDKIKCKCEQLLSS